MPPCCGEDEDERPASGNGRHRALDLKTRRALPVNSSPAVGHPADAGPCPAQGSRTPPHKANSIPVNVLPSSSSPPTSFILLSQTAFPRECNRSIFIALTCYTDIAIGAPGRPFRCNRWSSSNSTCYTHPAVEVLNENCRLEDNPRDGSELANLLCK